jgi:hypothetical protein
MKLTSDPFCFHLYDAAKNTIVACILSAILGADLVMLYFKCQEHQYPLVSTLGGIAFILLVLILLLVIQIKSSLKMM